MLLWHAPGGRPGQVRRPFVCRPRLESLEGRCLPSTVTNLDDAGAGSLRQAILDTPAGGTVDFQPGLSGTITLTSGELLINKDLTMAGPGADVLTVSGNQASRVFDIAASFTVAISGLTIADGRVSSFIGGGGVFNNGGSLALTRCTLSDNAATASGFGGDGGGIYNQGALSLTDSTLSGNSAEEGGGLYNASTAAVTGAIFSRNSVSGIGGGIANDGTLNVTGSTFGSNSATSQGGGIFNQVTLTLTNSTVSGNSSADGGGIANEGGLTVTGCTLGSNRAGAAGGIYNQGALSLTNSTLSGNTASGNGGGIYNFSIGAQTVSGCTLSGNTAAAEGGGIYTGGPFGIALRNTLDAGNSAPASPDLLGLLTSQGHNLIGDGTGGSGYDPTDLVGTADNPIDPLLGPLADNGGPTQTLALLPESPARNAGDSTHAPDFDQRGPGYARVVNGLTDIGAFEVQTYDGPRFVVTNANDAGPGSLRQAILDVNAQPGPDVIAFAMPRGSGDAIRPTAPLPPIVQPVAIDGTTQPGYAGQPLIEVSGSSAGSGADGLTLAAGGSTVRDLVINGFDGAAIHVEGAGGDLVTADLLGTDPTGTTALGNGAGVFIDGASENTVGGTGPGAGNLISGNRLDGVVISGSGNLVQGNRIGTDLTGTLALPNRIGVSIFYIGSNNTIGGTEPGAGNLLSGNRRDGVAIAGGADNRVEGNRIGTDASGTAALGNRFGVELFSGSALSTVGGTAPGAGNVIAGNQEDGVGIYSNSNVLEGNFIGTDPSGGLDLGNGGNGVAVRAFQYGFRNTIGGSEAGAGNTVAFNGQDGVLIDTGTGNAVQQNTIFANAGLGIELRNHGNQDQAAPTLDTARSDGSSTTVAGTLTSAPSTAFSVEFFVNAVCDPSGFGQGERFLGAALETTDATGQAAFTVTLGVGVSAGQFVTATATDPAGNTSAFSNCVQVERGAAGALTGRGTSEPGLAELPDAVPASLPDFAPAPAAVPVGEGPPVPGSRGMPAAGDSPRAAALGAGTDASFAAGPPTGGPAPADLGSADDLAALALDLLGGP
jgi:parallel beta-helix repeat protein